MACGHPQSIWFANVRHTQRLSRSSWPRGWIGPAFGQVGPLSGAAEPPPLTTAAARLCADTWALQHRVSGDKAGPHLAAVRRAARRRPPWRCRRRLAAGLWRVRGSGRGWPAAPRRHLATDLRAAGGMLAAGGRRRPDRRPAKDACRKKMHIASEQTAAGSQLFATSPLEGDKERGGVAGSPMQATAKSGGEADAGARRGNQDTSARQQERPRQLKAQESQNATQRLALAVEQIRRPNHEKLLVTDDPAV